jgi:PIN domain nuclease of toxin-antitoxin system
VSASGAIMQRAGSLDWTHRNPFDRIIVATALSRGLAVVSKDQALDTNGAPGWTRVW